MHLCQIDSRYLRILTCHKSGTKSPWLFDVHDPLVLDTSSSGFHVQLLDLLPDSTVAHLFKLHVDCFSPLISLEFVWVIPCFAVALGDFKGVFVFTRVQVLYWKPTLCKRPCVSSEPIYHCKGWRGWANANVACSTPSRSLSAKVWASGFRVSPLSLASSLSAPSPVRSISSLIFVLLVDIFLGGNTSFGFFWGGKGPG